MDYLELSGRTENKNYDVISNRMTDPALIQLVHAQLGLTTEVGEFADAIKRELIYGKEIDKTNIIEELGDLFWYLALACRALNVTFEQLQEINIKKLSARFPEGYSDLKAINRNVEVERTILEGE